MTSPARAIDADAALRMLALGTASATGEGFFRALVQNLARAMDTHGAWVTQYVPEHRRLRGLAFWLGGEWVEGYETDIAGTPCEAVVDGRRMVHIPDNALQLYPGEQDLIRTGAVSYLGVPLMDEEKNVLGHLAVLDRRPIPPDPRILAVFNIFAARAAAEHQRLAAEARLREREERLRTLVDSAMDAILDLDAEFNVLFANPAAARIFNCPVEKLVGRPFSDLLTAGACRRLFELTDPLCGGASGADRRAGAASVWVPGELDARRLDGEIFAAEATVSRHQRGGRTCHTLILRDVAERQRAQQTISYLRDELREARHCGQILGASPAIRSVIRQIEQVAPTDATVLILGETGTGKELIARAIHDAGRRKDKPLVRVNCAAIPAALIESEFFGHEKGAFTGATQRRDGRFALAQGGTIFLDEIGELPLELQPKLLRVLQEGEFETVGGSRTVKVDVRVIAATNRDLRQCVQDGAFREDLYYRLNVFPIRIPPLRDRPDDIPLLARAFADGAAKRIGKRPAELSDACIDRLRAYHWPGNVRELENVIERAVIISPPGRLNLDAALSEPAAPAPAQSPREPRTPGIQTIAQIESIERDNIRRALESCDWRISGAGGAAQLLDINPSTLRSRMKALNISRQT